MNYSDVRLFRVAAVAEAISWAGLLIGMIFKYSPVQNEIGVHVFGPIHGLLFVVFLTAAVRVRRGQRWSGVLTGAALLSAVPPFGTVAFQRWATRTGRLTEPDAGTVPG